MTATNMPPLELDYRMYAPSEVRLLIEQQTEELRAEAEKREATIESLLLTIQELKSESNQLRDGTHWTQGHD